MRPRGRGEDDDSSSPPRSETAAAPPSERSLPPPRATLSSLVVKLPRENAADTADPEAGATFFGDDAAARRRESPPQRRRRGLSPPDTWRRERRRSPLSLARRRGSPPGPRHRGSPPGIKPRYPGFHEEQQGYGRHAGFMPPLFRRKPESSNYDDAVDPHYVHGYQGRGRGDGRFRDVSPHYERGGRSYGRGYNLPGKEFIYIDGEYVHRNDPNLSPREGDWICQNPNCGNLNFARRTHCNNCNKHRNAPHLYESSHSPQRGYFNSPPCGSLRRVIGPSSDRALPREVTRFRSPPRGWGVDGPRDYAARSPAERVGRLADPVRRDRMDYCGDLEFGDRGKFEWEHNHRERPRGLYADRRGQRSASPWGNRGRGLQERSRSPVGDRLMKGSFPGRGRPDRDYADPFVGRGRPLNLGAGRGRGGDYRQGGNPYPGQGRGDRRVLSRGRKEEVY